MFRKWGWRGRGKKVDTRENKKMKEKKAKRVIKTHRRR